MPAHSTLLHGSMWHVNIPLSSAGSGRIFQMQTHVHASFVTVQDREISGREPSIEGGSSMPSLANAKVGEPRPGPSCWTRAAPRKLHRHLHDFVYGGHGGAKRHPSSLATSALPSLDCHALGGFTGRYTYGTALYRTSTRIIRRRSSLTGHDDAVR